MIAVALMTACGHERALRARAPPTAFAAKQSAGYAQRVGRTVKAQCLMVTSVAHAEALGTAWARNGHEMGTEPQTRRSPLKAGSAIAHRRSRILVAGARFELATFGL